MLTWSVSSITLAEVTQLELPNKNTHTVKHTIAINHTSPLLYPSISHVHSRGSSPRRNTSNSPLLFLFLSLCHPLLSLSVVLRHVLLAERFSASSTQYTQPCLSLSLSPYPSLLSVLFIRTGHAFLINHFHSFIYLFIFGLCFFFSCRFQALISCNLLAWHTTANESEREREREGGRVKYKTLIISCTNATVECVWVCVFVHLCVSKGFNLV